MADRYGGAIVKEAEAQACTPAAARPSPFALRAAPPSGCRASLTRAKRKRRAWCCRWRLGAATGWKIALAIPGSYEGCGSKSPRCSWSDQFLTKVHDKEDAMTLRVSSMEMRDMMLEAEPELFYITDHYRNFPFVLARLAR